ncbi:MAG: hypothetical protein FJ358_01505 [Thaumarchaeota archaeon]|nr:hypothetical protein [Nitrososphaerota archaeon]
MDKSKAVNPMDFSVFIQDGNVGKYLVERCEMIGCEVVFPLPMEVNSPAVACSKNHALEMARIQIGKKMRVKS